jgi:hypothetical protein
MRYRGWTEQAVKNLRRRTQCPRREVKQGVAWGQQRSTQTATGWWLCYYGALPRISNKQVNWRAVWQLTARARRLFGTVPAAPRTRARVQVIRVLGPSQRRIDRDKLALMTAGLVDALVPTYIRDDSEVYADISYTNDPSRRQDGPYIEIRVDYAPG